MGGRRVRVGDFKIQLQVLKMRKGPQAKQCGQPVDAGKGKTIDSSLESPHSNTALLTLCVCPVRTILDLDLQN